MRLRDGDAGHGTEGLDDSRRAARALAPGKATRSRDERVPRQTDVSAPGRARGGRATALSRESAPPEARAVQPGRREHARDAIAGSLGRFAEKHTLTNAETRILGLALRGLTRADIVREAGISVHTYQKHVRAIRDKVGAPLFQAAIQVLRAAVARAPRPANESVYEMLLS